MANRIVLNPISYHGKGAIQEIPGLVAAKGFQTAANLVIVCGEGLAVGKAGFRLGLPDGIENDPGTRKGGCGEQHREDQQNCQKLLFHT